MKQELRDEPVDINKPKIGEFDIGGRVVELPLPIVVHKTKNKTKEVILSNQALITSEEGYISALDQLRKLDESINFLDDERGKLNLSIIDTPDDEMIKLTNVLTKISSDLTMMANQKYELKKAIKHFEENRKTKA